MNKTIFKITAILICITVAILICSYYFHKENEREIDTLSNDSTTGISENENNIDIPKIDIISNPPEQKEPDTEGLTLDISLDVAPPFVDEPNAELIEIKIEIEQ